MGTQIYMLNNQESYQLKNLFQLDNKKGVGIVNNYSSKIVEKR
jgi:hypothetical protein